MARYSGISPQAKLILAQLVGVSNHITEFYWSAATYENPARIGFGHLFSVHAELSHLRELKNAALISIRADDENAANVSIEHAAHLAIRRYFEMPFKDYVLTLLYAVVGGRPTDYLFENQLHAKLFLSKSEIETQVRQLAIERLLRPQNGSDEWGPCYTLTPEAIALVDEIHAGNEEAAPMATSTTNITYANYGIHQQTGDVNQTVNSQLSEVFQLLESGRAAIAELNEHDRRGAEEQISHIKEELQTPDPKPKKILAFAAMAVKAAQGIEKFQQAMESICKRVGVEADAIKAAFHHPHK